MRITFFTFFYMSLALSSPYKEYVHRNNKTQQLWDDLYRVSFTIKASKTILGLQNGYTEGKWGTYDFTKPLSTNLPLTDIERVSQRKIKLIGYDFEEIGDWNQAQIIEWIKRHDELGGISTLSWHMKNPNIISPNNSSQTISPMPIRSIFTNQVIQQKLNLELDRLVDFLKKLDGVPIIFRPYHEHNESWFWWGKNHNDVYWYTHLWKYTIDYLRAQGIDNILIAYSPNQVTTDYLERYPGQNYVDILGTDYYFTTDYLGFGLKRWKQDVVTLQQHAKSLDKIPAITEFGNEGLVIENFWTDYLAWPIQKEGVKLLLQSRPIELEPINFAYVMLWRNAAEISTHYFAPYPRQRQNNNFFQLLAKNFLIFMK